MPRTLVVVLLALLGFVLTGCFQASQDAPASLSPAPAAGPTTAAAQPPAAGVTDISKPFSFSRTTGVPAPVVVMVAAEHLPFPVDTPPTAGYYGHREENEPVQFTSAFPVLGMQSARRTPSDIPWFAAGLPAFRPVRGASPAHQNRAMGAATYLDRPFNSLFESVFNRDSEEMISPPDAPKGKEEPPPNPFTQAKRQTESEPDIAASVAKPAPPSTQKEPPPDSTENSHSTDTGKATSATTQPVVSSPGPASTGLDGRYVFLGDFGGTGILRAAGAHRLDDNTFAFQDARRTFSLFINPAAVELQRSFAADDVTGDGIPDLLVTSRAGLFGGILLGDGAGNFRLADTFVTGYEPTVVTPGIFRDGKREILTVNLRTGSVVTFRAAERYRQVRVQGLLDFLPDYVGHLVELQSGIDCLMAGQAGRPARVYRWREDGLLNSSGENLPAEPGVSLDRDFFQENALGTVQIYQVGSYASILLTNSRRQSFNIANIRIMPQIFLAIGDLTNRGTLDVAVAYLVGASPLK